MSLADLTLKFSPAQIKSHGHMEKKRV